MAQILVVEDTPAIADLLDRVLRRSGYAVTVVSQGLDVISSIHKLRPAVVLMDMSLPFKDGWTLIREIRNSPAIADTKVIALTAHSSDEDRKRAIVSGYNDFVSKPFDYHELLTTLKQHLLNSNE